MKKILCFVIFFTGLFLQAQVNRVAFAPFNIRPKGQERKIGQILANLSADYLLKRELFQIVELEKLMQKLSVSFEDIYSWKKRKKAFKKLSKHVDYMIIAEVTIANDGIQLGVSAQLFRISNTKLLQSSALLGSKHKLRDLAKELILKLIPSKQLALKEIIRGYQKAYKHKRYLKAIEYCDWGLYIEPKSWQHLYQKAKAYKAHKSYVLAEKNYLTAARLYPGRSRLIEKDLKDILPLVKNLRKERSRYLKKILLARKQMRETKVFVHIEIFPSILNDLKQKRSVKRMHKRALRLQKLLNFGLFQLEKLKRLATNKKTNDKWKKLSEEFEEIFSEAKKIRKFLAKGHKKQAHSYYKKALKAFRRDRKGDMQRAFILLEKSILLHPSKAKPYYWQAIMLGKSGKYEESLQSFTLAIQYDAKFWEAYFNRGLTYKHLKEYNRAIKSFKKAIKIKVKFPECYYHLGEVYQKQKKYSLAIKYYTRAIKYDDKYSKAFLQRGRAYDYQHNYLKARTDYKRAMQLSPRHKSRIYRLYLKVSSFLRKDSAVYVYKAKACVAEGELQEALKYYQYAIESNPDNPSAYFERAFIYQSLSEYKKALKDYNEAISLKSNVVPYHYRRAICLQSLKKYKKALRDLSIVLSLNTYFHGAYHRRGLIYEDAKQYEKAARSIERALKGSMNKAHYYLDLSRIYRKLNKPGLADITWKRGRSLIK